MSKKKDVALYGITIAGGKYLDRIAYQYGLKRKRKFLFFKERDEELRKRILISMRIRRIRGIILDSIEILDSMKVKEGE